jgi:hypothetical protein
VFFFLTKNMLSKYQILLFYYLFDSYFMCFSVGYLDTVCLSLSFLEAALWIGNRSSFIDHCTYLMKI